MIKLLFPVPRKITVAFSGGVDSVAITDFLSKNHEVSCAFFHHGTQASQQALGFVQDFCNRRAIQLTVGYLNGTRPKNKSMEEFWREHRYEFLSQFPVVVTGHHLDDCVETYIWSALHGEGKIIPRTRNNVIRPFLLTPKQEFVSWCTRKNLEWVDDPSNQDTDYMRNYIRLNLLPHAYRVNPGLRKVVKKLVLDAQNN